MKFSVIIPTYSRIDLLEKAIESVNKQTYQNYEIVVVNDNFSDKIKVDRLIAKYEKIKVIHHSHSKGGNAARNTGILNSNGEVIAFLDDDDLWLPDKLSQELKEHQQNPTVGLVFSDCLFVHNSSLKKDSVTRTRLPSNVIRAMGKFEFCPPTTSAVSIKRECVEKCGLFDDKLVSLQDWDYWFRIAHFFKFSHIPKVLVHYIQHLGDRTSFNEKKRREGLDQICDKWRDEIDIPVFRKFIIRSIYNKNAKNALIAGEKFNAFKKSFKLLNKEVIGVTSLRQFARISFDILKTHNG